MPVIRVAKDTHETLIQVKGFLQIREKKDYSMDNVIRYLVSNAKDSLQIDLKKNKVFTIS